MKASNHQRSALPFLNHKSNTIKAVKITSYILQETQKTSYLNNFNNMSPYYILNCLRNNLLTQFPLECTIRSRDALSQRVSLCMHTCVFVCDIQLLYREMRFIARFMPLFFLNNTRHMTQRSLLSPRQHIMATSQSNRVRNPISPNDCLTHSSHR